MMLAEKVDSGITVWSKRLALVLLGWFASSAYHGTLTAAKVEKALPAVQAEAGCEHWRADTTAKLALSPNMITPAQIPKDCAHPKIDVPPAVSPAAK